MLLGEHPLGTGSLFEHDIFGKTVPPIGSWPEGMLLRIVLQSPALSFEPAIPKNLRKLHGVL